MSRKSLRVSMFLLLALLVILIALPSAALANSTYFGKIPATGYEKSCNLCHTSSIPTLNTFGAKFKAAGYDFSKLTTTTTTTTKPATTTTTTKPATTTTAKPAAPVGVTERQFADTVATAYTFVPSNPSATLTREGAAVYLVKILGLSEKAVALTTADMDKIFADAGIKDSKTIVQVQYVALTVKLGLLKGYGNGNFVPKGSLTAAQATILAKRVKAYDAAANSADNRNKSYLDVVSVISKDWSSTQHAIADIPFTYGGPRDGCQPCHSGKGIQQYGTDAPYTPGTGIKSNPDDKQFSMKFDPYTAELPRGIDCAACHSGTGGDILKTGVIPAKLNVYSGGQVELNVGSKNALCMTCHNGRRDVTGIYQAWTTPGAAKSNQYPHHGWGALATGKGGMEYPGVTYAQSTTHQSVGCIGCHMAKKDGVVSHEFKPNIATCNQCHVGQTEFTMGGNLKKELEEKLVILEKLVLAKIPGAVKIGLNHSTSPAVDKDGKLIPAKDIASVEALVGAYNWALVTQELENGAKGAHNPQYAKALLNESIKKLQ